MGLLALAIANPVVSLAALGIAVSTAAGGYIYLHHKVYTEGLTAGKAEVQVLWDEEKEARRVDAARRSAELDKDFKEIVRIKDAQIVGISNHLDSALARLSDRTSTRLPNIAVPATPECKGATGYQLSRPDAEFLTREAARADEFRAALQACYAETDSINLHLSPEH